MSNFDSEWLVNTIEKIVDAPRNPHSVIASGVDETASRAYAVEIRDYLSKREDEENRRSSQTRSAVAL